MTAPSGSALAKLSRMGRAAIKYAVDYGWRVFPLHYTDDAGLCSCGKADCGGPGKHPRTPRGCLDASTEPDVIRGWWTRWPDANVGIATGGGLVVIDVDPRSGGDDGMVDLRARLGALPDTVEALTGGGGRHVYLSTTVEVRNSAGVLAPGVDVRGEGGYVVAPPSTHASGRTYGWEVTSRPDEVELAPVPQAWLDAMTARPKLRVIPGAKGEPFPEGQRNASLYKRACSMRAASFDQPAILAAIMAENDARCVPPLDPAEVKAIVASACKHPEGHSAEVRAKVAARAAAAAPDATSPALIDDDGQDQQPALAARTSIEVTDNEHAVNDAVLEVLPREPSIYSRGGSLVRVCIDDSPVDARPPRTEVLPPASLREIISRRVAFHSFGPDRRGAIVRKAEHPPMWCVAAVHARGQWPGIRPLTGVVDAPVMRRDGTVLDTPGYDAPTGYLFCPRREFPRVPESPTPDDGTAAMARIADVVSEFPFDIGSDEDDPAEISRLNAAAALAMVLTLVARPMIAGAVPGWLIDAPDAGAGKSLLAKTLAAMGTGQVPDAERWHAEEDEWGKVHLGNLLEGRRVVFFDNVATGSSFGHAGLDGALTQWPLWKGRILGQTGNVSVRNDTLIVATGNNPTVPNDTIRRLVRVRLRPDVERPAEREIVYRYALPGDALTHAPSIITDALTALRAWVVAGRPTARLVPWGSFEEWAAIIPQVLAWYGYPDIHRTQDGLRAVDDGATALGMLLTGWEALGGDEGRSASEVLGMLRGSAPVPTAAAQEGVRLIREALDALDPKRRVAEQTPGSVGKLLAKYDGKVVGGRRIGRSTHKGSSARWIVRRTADAVPMPQRSDDACFN